MMKINAILKNHKITAYQIGAFVIFFLVLLLILNIVSSQIISPVYYKLTQGGEENAVVYLKKIRELPIFEKELEKYKQIYGNGIEDLVFDEERAIDTEIKKLEQNLIKNTYSRDILNRLYLLYRQKGDSQKAEYYLRQVKQIDPGF